MIFFILVVAGLSLAFANGANDNFKGVATLYGSGVTSYRRALAWATVTTLLGSLLAVVLAHELLTRFSGKGLVEEALTTDPNFLAAVGLGAALTVLLATRIGMPISTTHSLVGALVGTALAASSSIQWNAMGSGFVLPLLLSPLIAIAATGTLYPMLRGLRRRLGVTKRTCFCVGSKPVEFVPLLSHDVALARAEQLTVSLGTVVTCQEAYDGKLLGISSARALDSLHYLSSGLVSFARGLNDTPKIAALLLVVPALDSLVATVLCGLAIAVGGVAAARRVAETMSRRITSMNAGQGFTSNLVTGLLVVAASRWGLPVSTTHVSCGSLFGLGAVTGQARWHLIGRILLAWVVTLPLAGLLGALAYRLLRAFG